MSTTQPLVAQAVDALAPVLASVIVALLGWVGAALQRSIKNETVRNMALRFSELAHDVVLEMEQTVVSQLREAAADGAISTEELQRVKAGALEQMKAHLGDKGKKEALTVLGFADETQLDAYLSTKLEAAVAIAKQTVGRKLSAVLEASVAKGEGAES